MPTWSLAKSGDQYEPDDEQRQAVAREWRAATAQPRSIAAAAVRFGDFQGAQTWRDFRGGDLAWQAEAWKQYDICGELRYAVNWLGNAASLADLYAATVDPDTGKPGDPVTDPKVLAIVREVLGGPAARAQHIKSLVVNLSVPGEAFVLLRSEPTQDKDRWMVLSTTEITGGVGGDVKFTDPVNGVSTSMGPADILMRVWSPHPRVYREPDSAVRAALPTLREIERASQNIAARLDSRLASAGILVLPESVQFPTEDDEPLDATGFMGMLARVMSAALAEPGNAGSQVPITLIVPDEVVDKINHLTFDTPVSSQVMELRDNGRTRLAGSLDLPAEMITGMGDVNHWGAWQVEESTYKTHLQPVLDRLADDVTTAYFRGACKAAGVANPERIMLAWDPSKIIADPHSLADLQGLWDNMLISDDTLRRVAGVSDDEKPTPAEYERRVLERLVEKLPELLESPEIAAKLGVPSVTVAPSKPASTVLEGAEPAEDVAITGPPPEPSTPPNNHAQGVPSQTASADPVLSRIQAAADLTAASIAVENALGKAGARLLNVQRLHGQFRDVPSAELHTRVTVTPEQLDQLLAGAWNGTARKLADRYRLDHYARALLARGLAHDEELLGRWMRAAEALGQGAPAELVAAAVDHD